MSDTTNISWTDSTWNPWRGCRAVSPGCQNCYARTLVNGRMGGDFSKRVRAAKATFAAPLRWNKKPWVCDECGECWSDIHGSIGRDLCDCGGTLHRRRVFFGSLMDILDPEVPIEIVADAWDIVRRCTDLVFQCVTKRPELWRQRIQAVYNVANVTGRWPGTDAWSLFWLQGDYPKNVHIIASVEDQARADERIPELLKIPAVVHGLSVEPLLESLKYGIGLECGGCGYTQKDKDTLGDHHLCHNPTSTVNWVIVGGESGPHRRDCGVEPIIDIVRQCDAAEVPVFVKQDSDFKPGQQGRIPDEIWKRKEFPENCSLK